MIGPQESIDTVFPSSEYEYELREIRYNAAVILDNSRFPSRKSFYFPKYSFPPKTWHKAVNQENVQD